MPDDLTTRRDYLDTLDARSQFIQQFWYKASGIYDHMQSCEDHFDRLIRAGAFRPSWVRMMAAKWRHSEQLENVPDEAAEERGEP